MLMNRLLSRILGDKRNGRPCTHCSIISIANWVSTNDKHTSKPKWKTL